MPLKTCPKCKAKQGTRKKVCECGYSFAAKTNHPLVPEPGGWVLDTVKGMPPIEQPDIKWPKGKLDTDLIREEVSYEGLGYCIYSLIPAERIKDARLKKLWREARQAMQKIVEHLYEV